MPPDPRPTDRMHELVRLALEDASTYLDDGPFDERERASSDLHAFDLRRHFAAHGCSAEDARWIAARLRDPGVDLGRAVRLVVEASALLRSHNAAWDAEMRALASDPDPRLRELMTQAGYRR